MRANFEIPEQGLKQFLAEIAAKKEGCEDGTIFTIEIQLDTEKDEHRCTEVVIKQHHPDRDVVVYPFPR